MAEKPIRVAINGLGRIGRTILRQIMAEGAQSGFEVVHLNDIAPLETCAYLIRFDSVFGPFPGTLTAAVDHLTINHHRIPFTRVPDISDVDLSGVDILLECTGKAQTPDVARRGLDAGACQVLISGPSPAAEVTIVMGANDDQLGNARVVSNASCTTNALAPLIRIVDDAFGIDRAHMTTIHCYTGSQPMIDAPRDDLARSRAGALSMVPTTTSATRLIDQVLPHMAGRITGAAVRVPVASVSAVDVVVQLQRPAPPVFNEFLEQVAATSPVIGVTPYANVSTDLRARPESVILALPETQQIGDTQVRIFGWYDNEWGFSARMLDMARRMAAR
jgi:glyceraldehyde 3-phosphate dehydrogenase